jgi:RNA recognition motif-containing protein
MLQAGPICATILSMPPRKSTLTILAAANLHLPKDRVSMSHQGFGFCEFLTEADAEYACRIMNGIKIFGKPIRVNKVGMECGCQRSIH